jgi:hypothetical protein
MRASFSVLLFSLLVPLVGAAAENCPSGAALLDEKFGFRDVKFDARVEEIANLKQVPQQSYKTKRVIAYIRATDPLEIFRRPLIAVTYFFFDDRLFLIELQLSGRGDPIGILQGFRDALGCEFEKSDGPAGQDLSLRATGVKAKFYGSVHVDRTGTYGVVFFQKVGVQKAIDDAIQKEAATQF